MAAPRTNAFGMFRSRLQRLSPRTRVVLASAAVVSVLVAAGGASLAFGHGHGPHPHAARAPVRPTTSTTTTRRHLVPRRVVRCPLTAEAEPANEPVHRPALLVKVGNEPGPARPQSGLNEADIVFDTPAEGFVMRYVAVFECQDAATIGPLRSVRWVDYHLAPQFDHPILAFAGGIDPNVQAVAMQSGLEGANLLMGQSRAAYRTRGRRPPDNLYTSTGALYALFPRQFAAQQPLFRYGPALPAGARRIASAELRFSGGTDVVWQWDPSLRAWVHTYAGVVDVDALTNQPVSATNIVVEIVPYTIGPYIESTGGTGDIQSETVGRGLGYVLRNGAYAPVVWSRPSELAPTSFTTPSGDPVALAPGRTWIEIMTNVQAAGGIRFTL